MDRSTSNAPAPARQKPRLSLGATATTFFMMGLCIPLVWYAHWLHDRHEPATSLSGLPALELLLALGLLTLPFIVLRLLRFDWQTEQ